MTALTLPISVSSVLSFDAIRTELSGVDRDSVIAELVEGLARAGAFPEDSAPDVFDNIIERESLATTGIGVGIAVPHARMADIESLTATIGISKKGVDFDSIDGEPVHVILMIVAPSHLMEDHLQLLKAASDVLIRESTRKLLRDAQSADEILEIINLAELQEAH
jgi:mannitol/fructose-specific phosphotransferase system IIA component (Ntr-type)